MKKSIVGGFNIVLYTTSKTEGSVVVKILNILRNMMQFLTS
jgi:hypothetical protein